MTNFSFSLSSSLTALSHKISVTCAINGVKRYGQITKSRIFDLYMITSFAHPSSFLKKHLVAILLVLIWMIVAVVVFIQSTIAMWLHCEPNDTFTSMIVGCGWLFWSLLTPFVLHALKRVDALNLKMGYEILVYAALSILFVAIHIVLQKILFNLAYAHKNFTFSMPNYILYHIHTQFVVFFFIVFAMKGISFYRNYLGARLKEEKLHSELSNARLSALKMQLNPHFLFNTHHSIISSMTMNDNKKASGMLMKLSDFLRITLDNENQVSSLFDELKLMNLYLDIQKIRLGDKLTVTIDIEPGTDHAAVPTFLLQPLVENAILHGICPYSQAGTLCVSTRKRNDMLEIEVTDNGGGIRDLPLNEGIGLKNTKGRLKELYGDRAGFSVLPHPVKGTITKVWLPFSLYNPSMNEHY